MAYSALTLPLTGRFLIEASAGTGKTWTLTLLVLRLLVERGLDMRAILVLTYTQAAAAELKGRIRERLITAQRVLAGEEHDGDVLRILERAPNTPTHPNASNAHINEASSRLDRALKRLDEANIATIHSFCQTVMREQGPLTGLPLDLDVLADEKKLRLETIADFWRQRFYRASREECELALHFWPGGPQALLYAVQDTLRLADDHLVPKMQDGEELTALCGRLEIDFARILSQWSRQGHELCQLILEDQCVSHSRDNYCAEKINEIAQVMAELAAKSPVRFPRFLPPSLELLSASAMQSRVKKLKKCQDWQAAPFFSQFAAFWHNYAAMLQNWQCRCLVAARAYVQKNLRRKKREQGLMGYDDMPAFLAGALQDACAGPVLKKVLKERYLAVLVDEFQDTDPCQYAIFQAFCASRKAPREQRSDALQNLFVMIGDPKQAIYSFRGADIFTYMAAKRSVGEDAVCRLDVNYRSRPAMVAALNALFTRQDNPFIFQEIPFYEVKADGQTARDNDLFIDGIAPAPLHFLWLSSADQENPLPREHACQKAALACAQSIKKLLALASQGRAMLDEKPLKGSDMAILTQSHRQAGLIREALAQQGIASVYAGKSSVFSSPEALEVLVLLRALFHTRDQGLAARALAGPFFHLDAAGLDHARQEIRLWEGHLKTLQKYGENWRCFGAGPALYGLLREKGLARRLSLRANGERALTNYLHLFELLHEEEQARPGQKRLLNFLEREILARDDASAEKLMRLESDEALVKIYTEHGSKGLEFPLVFLPFLFCGAKEHKNGPAFFHDRLSYEAWADFAPGEEHKKLASEEEMAESMRLLYVALTRAKYALFLAWGRVKGMDTAMMSFLLYGREKNLEKDELALRAGLNAYEDLVQIWPFSFLGNEEAKGRPEPGAAPEKLEIPAARPFTGSISRGYLNSSYSALALAQSAPAGLVENEDREEDARPEPAFEASIFDSPENGENFQDISTFPRGTHAGSCLHHILECLDFSRPASEQGELVAHTLARFGFDERWLKALLFWLDHAVLRTVLPHGRALSGLMPQDTLRELRFCFPVHGLDVTRLNALLKKEGLPRLSSENKQLQSLMNGSIDLCFRHEGRFFLVDYKSNFLGPSPENYQGEAMEAAMTQHFYHLQYLIYTLALHRHLKKRLAGYDVTRHFGGVYYLFVRGMQAESENGIFQARPSASLIEGFDALCREGEAGYETL